MSELGILNVYGQWLQFFCLSLDWDFHFCLIWKQQHFTTGM